MGTTAMGTVLQTLRRSLRRLEIETLTDGELLERFVRRRDEAAFEALVHRHGPMVFGACRRLLQNDSDAEDAFQATFLVLVRKANSVRPREMVGNWLYGVAHSTALKARAMRSKRSARERDAAAQAQSSVPEADWEDLEGLLDQELKSLPHRYRTVIVLCDLEGMSLKEAARELGCPPATIGTRLARGRTMLARRLRRQGVTASAGALAVMLSQHVASAAVPTTMAASFLNLAAGGAAAASVPNGGVSIQAAGLAESVLKSMLLVKLKVISALLLPVFLGLMGLVGPRWSESGHFAVATLTTEQFPLSSVVPEDHPQQGFPVAALAQREPELISPMSQPAAQRKVESQSKKKLPPGLVNKPANHAGRNAWLKSHGS